LRKKALKEQATARSLDNFSLLMDETTGGSARSSSLSPRHGPAPATELIPSASTDHAGGQFLLYFFLLPFLFLAPTFMRIASTISSATCSPSAPLLLPAVKTANLCIERPCNLNLIQHKLFQVHICSAYSFALSTFNFV